MVIDTCIVCGRHCGDDHRCPAKTIARREAAERRARDETLAIVEPPRTYDARLDEGFSMTELAFD